MLFLLFELASDRYALDVDQIAEVLPLVRLKRIPQAPAAVAGVFNHHGSPVPVIDLSALMLGRPAESRLSTRLILVRYPDDRGEPRLLGLIAEHATATMRRAPGDFVASGVTDDDAPYLGPVATDARGVVQWVRPATLLPPAVQAALFRQCGEGITWP
jgi:chemotaxis-related protein WspB